MPKQKTIHPKNTEYKFILQEAKWFDQASMLSELSLHIPSEYTFKMSELLKGASDSPTEEKKTEKMKEARNILYSAFENIVYNRKIIVAISNYFFNECTVYINGTMKPLSMSIFDEYVDLRKYFYQIMCELLILNDAPFFLPTRFQSVDIL